MTAEERELAAKMLIDEIPRPAPAESVSAAGLARSEDLGLQLFASHYRTYGVGPIEGGRLMLCAPDVLDEVIKRYGLTRPGETALAIGYTSVGMAHAITNLNREIMIDPLTLTVHVASGSAPEDSLDLQTTLALAIQAVVLGQSDQDQPIDLEGEDLHDAAARRLGPLRYGEVYGFISSMEDEDRFLATNMQKMEINAYLLREWEREEFEIEYF